MAYGDKSSQGDITNARAPDDSPIKLASVLTPEVLVSLLSIESPKGVVTVKGIASSLTVFPKPPDAPKFCYGELSLGAEMIKFRVPIQSMPDEREHVLLCGTLRIARAIGTGVWQATHQALLVGDVVGRWTPRNAPAKTIPTLKRERTRLAFSDFIEQFGADELGFIVTPIAWEDIRTAAGMCGKALQGNEVLNSVTDADGFLRALDAMTARKDIRGLVISRGGGGGREDVGNSPQVVAALLATGLPYYSAIGHSVDLLLIDKYADGSFPTPSMIGTEIARVGDALARDGHFDSENRRLLDENSTLQRQIAAIQAVSSVSAPPSAPSVVSIQRRSWWDGGIPLRWVAALSAIVLLVAKCSK